MLGDAVDIVTHLREAGSRRAFEHAVSRFTQLIGRVPDAAVADISIEDIGVLQTFGEEVIERIEERAGRVAVPGPHEQALISRLYEIRRLLEEIHQWRRHFANRRPS
jgi:hypothetical protein